MQSNGGHQIMEALGMATKYGFLAGRSMSNDLFQGSYIIVRAID